MNNRTITYLGELGEKIIDFVSNILLPQEKRVQFLEALGPDGLFENIPRAENLDLPAHGFRQAGVDTSKIKAIFNYKTALCRQAIWEIKYRANKKLIKDFSLLLYEFILDELADLETFDNFRKIILLPIPSSKAREREKGFNQCILIGRELIKIDKERNGNSFTLVENFLIKKVNTEHQARVSNRKKRLENLINTFSVNHGQSPKSLSPFNGVPNHSESLSGGWPSGFSFIIIDDVITTGATMNEAFRALKTAGVRPNRIRGYAIAH